MTWPLASRLDNHMLAAKYHWDAYTNTMIMVSRLDGATGARGLADPYDNYFFAPIDDTIVFNENHFGLSLLFAPFYLATGNPLLAYNLVLLLSLSLAGHFTAVLVRRLTGSAAAGFVSGVAFAFCPYAMFEIGRIQLVATQWIPLCFLFLHRTFEGRRLADALGFALAYALQVGTCLYYAMFLLPLLLFVGLWLLVRHRPHPIALWAKVGAAGALCGAAVLGMTRPYFVAREAFSLVRAHEFAEGFDGELAFLLHVHPTNKLLRFLHHVPASEVGAHEEIAFPGFTIGLLALGALAAGIASGLAASRRRWIAPALFVGGSALALVLTIYAHTLLVGALVVAACAVAWHHLGRARGRAPSPMEPYAWALALALALFLGITPFEAYGEPIRGLYHYLYAYVPGFDGIRKVSRQAVMVMFVFAVLAGFGAARLLARVHTERARGGIVALLVVLVSLEFLSAPATLKAVPAGDTVPRAHRWLASRPGASPIAVIPAADGLREFRGPPGMAFHNYLATLHGRRTLNGKSSWIPPVTELFHSATREFPSETSTRIMQILGAEFLLIHSRDMPPARTQRILTHLDAHGDRWRRTFAADGDYVYELRPARDPSLALVETPRLPQGLMPVVRERIVALASREEGRVRRALDGDADTFWGTRRNQRVGDWFELGFDAPARLQAVEFLHHRNVFDAPAAFRLETFDESGAPTVQIDEPRLRIARDQVHRPRQFVFRVVLGKPVETRRVRFTLSEAVPGKWWTIHEARVWVAPVAQPGP